MANASGAFTFLSLYTHGAKRLWSWHCQSREAAQIEGWQAAISQDSHKNDNGDNCQSFIFLYRTISRKKKGNM